MRRIFVVSWSSLRPFMVNPENELVSNIGRLATHGVLFLNAFEDRESVHRQSHPSGQEMAMQVKDTPVMNEPSI
jgi:hypothetical protein